MRYFLGKSSTELSIRLPASGPLTCGHVPEINLSAIIRPSDVTLSLHKRGSGPKPKRILCLTEFIRICPNTVSFLTCSCPDLRNGQLI